jgi:hypothetical protein
VELDRQESDFVITKAAISKALNGKNQKQLSSGPCRMTADNSRNTPIPTLLILAEEAALFIRESRIQHC